MNSFNFIVSSTSTCGEKSVNFLFKTFLSFHKILLMAFYNLFFFLVCYLVVQINYSCILVENHLSQIF
ncbi:hypothetical protein [Spiroplasma endosymbiont of Virgichneumon dumeticola]|uniref:hypothetical protein n=1 Tax=Spiroplasma endosymbiont of Virgichneumon dumeticola TaxID=3139323 RepID=UPI0035C89B36